VLIAVHNSTTMTMVLAAGGVDGGEMACCVIGEV
jgi:hypothetical protein